MEAAVWTITILVMAAGLMGAFIPVIPGAPIILLAAVGHKFLLPRYLSVWTLAVLAGLAAVAVLLDMACSIGGAKCCGATAWGILGGGIGALAGLLGGVCGLLAGAVLGAALGEMIFARKSFREAAKAGLGAGLGLLASSIGRAALCLVMIALFALDCVF